MKEQLYSKVNLKIIAQQFKKIRTEKGYSLRGIAEAAKLSHVVVSDFENARVFPNLETLALIFKQLDIAFCIDLKQISKYKRSIDMLYEGIYYKYPEHVKKHYTDLDKVASTLRYSLIAVDYSLAKVTYRVSVQNDIDTEELKRLEKHYEFYSEHQKVIFNLVIGASYFKLLDIDKAVFYLKRNLEILGNRKAYALTLTYLAQCFLMKYTMSNALYYANRASSLHGEYASFARKISTDLMIAKIYLEMEQFLEAQRIIASIELTINQDEHFSFFKEMWFLKSYYYYRLGDYEQALTIYQNRSFNEPYSFIYEAFIYYQLREYDKVIRVIDESFNHEVVMNDFVYSRVTKVTKCYFTDNFKNSNYEKWCEELLNSRYKIIDHHLYRLVYEMLLRYYEHHNKIEEALKLSKKYIHSFGQTRLFEKKQIK